MFEDFKNGTTKQDMSANFKEKNIKNESQISAKNSIDWI